MSAEDRVARSDAHLRLAQVVTVDGLRLVGGRRLHVAGNRQLRLLSSEASGSSRVCPGAMPTPTTCNAPNGCYTFVVEATNGAGAVSSDRSAPPGFRVYPPIG